MAEQHLPCPGCGGKPFVAQCGDPPRRLLECSQCSFNADEKDWSRRTPGPATQAIRKHFSKHAKDLRWSQVAHDLTVGEITGPEIFAFIAEWSEPATPPAPEQHKTSSWKCNVCGESVRIADDLTPRHVRPDINRVHAAELSDTDRKTLANGIGITD